MSLEQYLDLDFTSYSVTGEHFTGCNPNPDPPGTFRGIYEDKYAEELIPRSQWDPLIEKKDDEKSWITDLITRIFDQGQEGACVSDTMMQCHESLQSVQFGTTRVIHMSAMSLYRRVGSSAGSGSTLDENIQEVVARGALPLNNNFNKALFKHTHPNTGFNLRLPSGWEETASLFSGAEYLDITSWEGLVTCLIKGYPVMYARNGHCITAAKIKRGQNGFILCYVNSWGRWGDPVNDVYDFGLGYDSENLASRNSRGAICVRSVNSPHLALSL